MFVNYISKNFETLIDKEDLSFINNNAIWYDKDGYVMICHKGKKYNEAAILLHNEFNNLNIIKD